MKAIVNKILKFISVPFFVLGLLILTYELVVFITFPDAQSKEATSYFILMVFISFILIIIGLTIIFISKFFKRK